NTISIFSKITWSKLSNGMRSWVVCYNAILSLTWLFNTSFTWGHNYLTETPLAPNINQIINYTDRGDGTTNIGPDGTHLTGIYNRQSLGFYENTEGDNYDLTFDTQKVVHRFGEHTFSLGYHYERNAYVSSRHRSGPT